MVRARRSVATFVALALAAASGLSSFAGGGADETQSRARFETVQIAGLNVSVWRPAAGGDAPLPLIVFSPGFTACSTQSSFLTAGLAAAGYLVVAPDHHDSACVGGGYEPPEAPFGEPQAWSEGTYRQRGRDIATVLDFLKSDPRWAPRIDASRIGLMGHSLGGYTVLALAGAWPSWQRGDVKAVLALAPLIGPLLLKGRLDNIHVPVMYEVGSRDGGTTALIKKRGGAYDRTGASAYLAELKEANHFAWTDDAAKFPRENVALGTAFFDAALKGKPFARPRSDSLALFKMK
jgi:predicted dienelactone hydrolase